MKKNKSVQLALLSFFLIFLTFSASAQNPEPQPEDLEINPDNFQEDIIRKALLKKVNIYRASQKLDSLMYEELLEKVAKDQANYMDKKDEVTDIQSSGKKKDTGKRLKLYGGSTQAEELVAGQPIGKGKDLFTYTEAVTQIFTKWAKGKKTVALLLSSTNIFTGVGVTYDALSKKIYVSQVFGGVKSFNLGASKKKELKVPFTKKKYWLKPFDEKECKACAKFTDWDRLHEGLYVENGKIFIKYNDLKSLQKLFKNSKDGFAVDVIQKDQYPCDKNYNIYDNNLLSKGVFVKRKYSKKIFKGNLVKEPKEKVKGKKAKINDLNVMLGKMPPNINEGDYEMNLAVIINKRICKVISRKYMEMSDMDSETPIDLIPDTVLSNPNLKFTPTAESNILQFFIPFQKNKFDYAPDDIKPFINSLNEPDFIIDEIVISAYSSIEGDSVQNADLQKKRAESILKSLEVYQKEKTVKQVITGDSWEEFKKAVAGTAHDTLASMTKEEANKTIYTKRLLNELEPVLAKGRYAKIIMDVTFDIKGKKEYPYVVKTLEKAIKKNDIDQAISIQNFCMDKVLSGFYEPEPLLKVVIPNEPKYARLLLNKLWFDKQMNGDSLNQKDYETLGNLVKMAPDEEYIIYNAMFAEVELGTFSDTKQVDSLQKKIDGLYSSKINKKALDGLNLEFQFKVIDWMDTTEVQSPLVLKSIEKIKKIFNIEESSWQNALKLSYAFAKKKDYPFAAKLLEPFIYQENVGEILIFTYIAISSNLPESLMSSKFNAALNRAKEMNKERYCSLFGAPNLSFQVLDNPLIKGEYCKACK